MPLQLRCGWELSRVSSHCVCGALFSANHAMIFRYGGLTFIRHNELRDLTANWLHDDVGVESPLQPLTGERGTISDRTLSITRNSILIVNGKVHI